MARRAVVPLVHQGSNHRFRTWYLLKSQNILSVGVDVSIDSEAPVVISSISRPAGSVFQI
jgi:hypothetical protein